MPSPSSQPSMNDAVLEFQAQTDALLEQVGEQLDCETFTPEDSELIQSLIEHFADPRGMKRLRLAETLAEIGEPTTPHLIEALGNHPNPVVRRAAAKTLTLIADTSAIPQLVHSFLHDEDTVVNGSSVGALARMGAAAVPLLIDILKAPDTPETTCGHAAWALAFIGVEAEPFLYQEFKSDLPRVRAAVVGAIAKVAQEHPEIQTAIELPLQALDDEDAIVRNEAISALANLDRVSALPQILQLLEHEDPETRKSVALATMKLGSGADIERLQAAMTKETEPGLQSVFKLAISQLERKTAGDDWD